MLLSGLTSISLFAFQIGAVNDFLVYIECGDRTMIILLSLKSSKISSLVEISYRRLHTSSLISVIRVLFPYLAINSLFLLSLFRINIFISNIHSTHALSNYRSNTTFINILCLVFRCFYDVASNKVVVTVPPTSTLEQESSWRLVHAFSFPVRQSPHEFSILAGYQCFDIYDYSVYHVNN